MSNQFKEKDILNFLDEVENEENNPYEFWFNLDDPNFSPSSSCMHLYVTENDWAIIFEKAGYSKRFHSIDIEVTVLGNILEFSKETSNVKSFTLMDSDKLDSIEDGFELIQKSIDCIWIKEEKIPVIQDIKTYKLENIDVLKNEKGLIDIESMIRMCNKINPNAFRATNDEINSLLPKKMEKLLTIDSWHHEHYSKHFDGEISGKKPSSYETFRLIAKILVSRDTNLWKPKLKPNNDWRNWTDIGIY